MNWIVLNTIIGAIVPVLVEVVANKLQGTKKLIAAVVITFVVAFIKTAAEGNLNFSNFDMLLSTFIMILTASQVFWRTTWANIFNKK